MQYNKNAISLREGKVFVDGIEIMDSVTCEIKFTPDTWTGRQLGEKTPSTRWLGYSISGSITRRRSTPWLKEKIAGYIKSGKTPEFIIQGIMNDPNSDYFSENGSDTVTAVGCVITGDISLTRLDTNGDVLDDNITFNAKDVTL